MRKYAFVLVAFVAIVLSACGSGQGNAEKFLGTWQSVKFFERPHLLIEMKGENLVISDVGGKNVMPATYDKENKKIVVNMATGGALDVIYLADKDHILVTEAGEYSRVK